MPAMKVMSPRLTKDFEPVCLLW